MSKAILVMDMPENCSECDLQQFGRCYSVKRSIVGTPQDLKRKPDWCPLKPMPEKKELQDVLYLHSEYFDLGYNACIDEILKGAEENG